MTEHDHETADIDLADETGEPFAVPLIPQPHGGALMEPIKPGHTRNPHGRPTDAQRLVRLLLARHPESMLKAADAWADVLQDPASRHWLGALREAMDRTEGPVVRELSHHVSTDRAIVTHASPPHPPALPEDVDVDPTSKA